MVLLNLFIYFCSLENQMQDGGKKNHVSTKLKTRTPTPNQELLLPFYSPHFTFFLHSFCWITLTLVAILGTVYDHIP